MNEHRWIVLTGATGGIGEGICARCVQDGYRIIAIGRDAERLAALEQRFSGSVFPLVVDLQSADIGDLLVQHWERLDAPKLLRGIVHAAAISEGDVIERTTDKDWYASIDVNATSIMRILRAATAHRLFASDASVVVISSPVALVGARKVAYSASKAALHGMNAALATRLGEKGIRVNAILPGPTITGMTEDWDEDKRNKLAKQSPLGRLCTPADTAGVVSFLLSPDAAMITGTIIDATGGRNIGLI